MSCSKCHGSHGGYGKGCGGSRGMRVCRDFPHQKIDDCFVDKINWDVPLNVYWIRVEVYGASGGGGGGGRGGLTVANNPGGYGGGGGAGTIGEKITKMIKTIPGSCLSLRPGKGGSGGISSQDGNAGEDSLIVYVEGTNETVLVLAKGGLPGQAGGDGTNATAMAVGLGGDGGNGGDSVGNSSIAGEGGDAGANGDLTFTSTPGAGGAGFGLQPPGVPGSQHNVPAEGGNGSVGGSDDTILCTNGRTAGEGGYGGTPMQSGGRGCDGADGYIVISF